VYTPFDLGLEDVGPLILSKTRTARRNSRPVSTALPTVARRHQVPVGGRSVAAL
jgi:hypothetical protein